MVQFKHGNQQAYGKQNYKNSKHTPDQPAQVVNRSQSLAPSIFFCIGGNAQIKLDATDQSHDVVLLLAEKWMMSTRSAREKKRVQGIQK